MNDDIQQALTKAEKLLRVAEWAIEQELYDGAALCYYAALFWAAIAALAHQGIKQKFWTHGGLRETFSMELILRRKLYPPSFGEWLNKAYNLRDMAHYHTEMVGAKEIRRLVRHAREFITKVSEVTKR